MNLYFWLKYEIWKTDSSLTWWRVFEKSIDDYILLPIYKSSTSPDKTIVIIELASYIIISNLSQLNT